MRRTRRSSVALTRQGLRRASQPKRYRYRKQMCILKVYSENESFKEFAKKSKIPVHFVRDKGERKSENKTFEYNRISFVVSDLEWDDFHGQVKEAISFLTVYFEQLDEFLKNKNITSAYLDFPIYSKLNDQIVSQYNHLPKELIVLSGKLNLGIEISIYSTDWN